MPAKKIACIQCLGFVDRDKGWAWDEDGEFEAWLEPEGGPIDKNQTALALIAFLMNAAEDNNN